MWWAIGAIVVVAGTIFYLSICKAASDADDYLEGMLQDSRPTLRRVPTAPALCDSPV